MNTKKLLPLIFANVQDIEKTVEKALNACPLPENRDARILLKPNFNNDMNSLMGGTTDLRIIISVLKFLKEKYTDITIGDGPNCGCYHDGIDVFKRLRVDEVAKKYGAKLVNFNEVERVEIQLGNQKAMIAKICVDHDFMINLPKIKTHSEYLLSCCTKNLMGCLSGLNKRKAHNDMATNLLALNEIIHPDFHIIDGLIAMENKGPNAGTPTKLNMIIAGVDPFQLDSYCSKIIGLNWRDIQYIKKAIELKKEAEPQDVFVPDDIIAHDFKKAPTNSANSFLNILYSNTFVMARYNKLLDPLFSMDIINDFLYKIGIKQERYLKEDAIIERIKINKNKCTHCKKCSEYCPLGLSIDEALLIENCLKCLYCYSVCPEQAISVEGTMGFLKTYLKKTDKFREKF